jgi:FKBP-type peptidyl-prolyl cis-trans isomerase
MTGRYEKEDQLEAAMKKLITFISIFAMIFVFNTIPFAGPGIVIKDSGLKYMDLVVGTGATAEMGEIAVIHLTGWIDDNGQKGAEFISSHDRGKPVSFKLGTGQVMKGWNEGVAGMKVGGRRRLMIPSKLGYGAKGAGELVPPDADLIFEVELLEVK